MCRNSEAKTGYRVSIRRKFHRFFKELAFTRNVSQVASAPSTLDVRGNCVPAALWHLMEPLRAQIGAHLEAKDNPRNVKASERGVRTRALQSHALHACKTNTCA